MTSQSEIHQTLDRISSEVLEALRGRSLLLTSEWSSAEIGTKVTSFRSSLEANSVNSARISSKRSWL